MFTNNESHVESNPRWKMQKKYIKVWLLLVFGIFTVFVVNLWLPGSGLDLALFPASQLFPLGLKFNSVPMEKLSRLATFYLTFFDLTHFFGQIILYGFVVFVFFSSTLCPYVIEISLKQTFSLQTKFGNFKSRRDYKNLVDNSFCKIRVVGGRGDDETARRVLVRGLVLNINE